jgi:hypothetical protein
MGPSNLLLFHQLGVGAVVYDIFAKHGCGKRAIDVLGIDVAQLPVQDEFVSFRANIDSRLLAEEYKCKTIAMLLSLVSSYPMKYRVPLIALLSPGIC